MQLFTRSMVALALLVLSLAPTLAANITILVGDNFYRGPGNTNRQEDIRNIAVGHAAASSHAELLSRSVVSGNGPAALQSNSSRAAGVELSVYPNPSHGQVTVQLSQPAGTSDYQLRLSNIIGQEIRTVALRPELTAAGLSLDLSDLRSGVYFYSLLVDGKVASTKRLVLQN